MEKNLILDKFVKEWVNTKEYYKYNQYTKQNVRHTALFKAVEILTSKRGQSCCVKRNYVRRLYDYFTLSEDISQNKAEAQNRSVARADTCLITEAERKQLQDEALSASDKKIHIWA